MNPRTILAALAIGASLAALPALAQPISTAEIKKIVASPERSAADRTNDLRRHPEQILEFIAIRPGITALDVSAGGGYTTELLARSIGPTGKVYGQSRPRTGPPPTPPKAPEGNSHPSTTPAELADGKLDLVTLMFNYHDMGFLNVDRAAMNKAIFRALKPGGFFVIADHSGRPGTGISESGTLHRVEEAFLRQEVEAAGFKLAAEGNFLRNPNDPRDKNTPDPPQPKDEFVLKFVKP